MRRFLKILAGIIVAVLLGVVTAIWMIADTIKEQAITNGPWQTLLEAGSNDAGLYGRTAIAIGGLLALNKQEAIYYNATHDADGQRLAENCDYQVIGTDPDARWWSLTAYGFDNYLIQNGDDHHSIAQSTVMRQPDGSFEINVSAISTAHNWISVLNGGKFALTLRLYNPSEAVYAHPATVTLPTIKRGACR